MIAALMNLRSRLSGISTGDQAIFVRRAVFETLGGYAEIPLMEDIELTRRLKRAGRLAALRLRVTTAARKWEQEGVARTIVLMWTLRLLYVCRVSPARLHRWYYGPAQPPGTPPAARRRVPAGGARARRSPSNLAYAALLSVTLARGLDLKNCGCFGVFLARPLRWFSPLEDLVFAGLSWLLYRNASRPPSEGRGAHVEA